MVTLVLKPDLIIICVTCDTVHVGQTVQHYTFNYLKPKLAGFPILLHQKYYIPKEETDL